MASVGKREWTYKGEARTAWVVAYKDCTGKPRLKTFKLKKDADRHRTRVEAEVERGTHVADAETVSVSEALNVWLEHCEERVRVKDRIRPRTLRNFRSMVENHIRPQIGHRFLTELSIPLVQKWIDDLAFDRARPRSYDTIFNTLVCLRLALKHAMTMGRVGRNLLKEHQFRVPGRTARKVDVPTKDEVRRFLAESSAPVMGGPAPYLRPMLFGAVFAGLRQGELRALRWENVDFEQGIIRVREAADNFCYVDEPKTAAGVRDVPIAPPLMTELKRWKLASFRRSKGLVFQGNRGEMVQQSSIQQSWKRLQYRLENEGKAAGAGGAPKGKFHFHALRHVCASLLIESGLPPKRIQLIMGHTSVQLTFDTYGHLFDAPGLVEEAMGKIGREMAV